MDKSAMSRKISELLEILEREKRALSGPPTGKLSSIAVEKAQLLDQFSGLEARPDILAELDEQTVSELELCKLMNQENNLLVNQRLKIVREVNQLISRNAGISNVELYDGIGRVVTSRRGKSLSQA